MREQGFGLFDADAADIFAQRHARDLLEELAKVKSADVDVLRDEPQRERFLEMGLNKLLRAGNNSRLPGGGGHGMTRRMVGQILGKYGQQMNDGLDTVKIKNRGFEIGRAGFFLPIGAPSALDIFERRLEIALGSRSAEHLSAEQGCHLPAFDEDGHASMGQPGRASDLLRVEFLTGVF
jgi:hypothetical protein